MSRTPLPYYERKFATLLRLLAEAKAKSIRTIIIPYPTALGDNYDELIESLNRLAQDELALRIVSPSERARHSRD